MSTDCTGSNLDVSDEQSLVLVQGSTLKRVSMESEREKSRREEPRGTRDSAPKGDSLLKLIRKLQQLQASGPVAKGARSPGRESVEVARHVAKYQARCGCSSASMTATSGSAVLPTGTGAQFRVVSQTGFVRCVSCLTVVLSSKWEFHDCGNRKGCCGVYILVPDESSIGRHP